MLPIEFCNRAWLTLLSSMMTPIWGELLKGTSLGRIAIAVSLFGAQNLLIIHILAYVVTISADSGNFNNFVDMDFHAEAANPSSILPTCLSSPLQSIEDFIWLSSPF